jgi:hypothetical protein
MDTLSKGLRQNDQYPRHSHESRASKHIDRRSRYEAKSSDFEERRVKLSLQTLGGRLPGKVRSHPGGLDPKL